ncbi:MAG: hypothetical protein JSR77_09660 [Planctomycetes bacterium]|nr:hypothetical protein [Planctomycetota bacterium]
MDPGQSSHAVAEQALQERPPRTGGALSESASPAAPRWAEALATGSINKRRISLRLDQGAGLQPEQVECEIVLRAGRNAALCSVILEGDRQWSEASFEAAIQEMIGLSLNGLGRTCFSEPARVWNFLSGITEPVGDGLDRYRVFNIARHKTFAAWFGDAAVTSGRIPPASCVGHSGNAIAIHTLGAMHAVSPVENPRQVPAFAYSSKFGPRPPCFSRAGIASFGGEKLLMIAGTSSVRGEDSVYEGSLADQLNETVKNLRAVAVEGLRLGTDSAASDSPLGRARAVRVYYRRPEDQAFLEQHLPRELAECPEVEFMLADICREELLVEIEVVLEVTRA